MAKKRNYNIHGYLGFENLPVTDAIKRSWQDVLQYTSVHQVKGETTSVTRDDSNDLFLISVLQSPNRIGDVERSMNCFKNEFRARYLIVATGIDQVKPNIPNFDKFLGNGIWHCPHCDGFSATNKKLIIIASQKNIEKAIDYAKIFLGWTADITLFLHEPIRNSNKPGRLLNDIQRKEVDKLGIKVEENDEIVKIIEDPQTGKIQGVLTQKTVFFKADILFYHLGTLINNKIPLQLGCKLYKGYLKVNEKQQTSLPKVYAVGDIDTDRHYAVLASASGAVAAQNIFEELLSVSIHKKKNNPHTLPNVFQGGTK